MSALRVFVSGQRSFGAAVAGLVVAAGHDLAGVASPAEGPGGATDRLTAWAGRLGYRWVDSAGLGARDVPDGVDVLLAAHSHAFLGERTRARAAVSVGYHPSLLPLHRGRDAVRWTIRDGDRVTGGTVYHLTNRIDGGPIAAQDFALVPPGSTATSLWRDVLFPMGLVLIERTLADVARGTVAYVPQDESCATWEPSWERPRLHRPELPELPSRDSGGLKFSADPALLRRPA